MDTQDTMRTHGQVHLTKNDNKMLSVIIISIGAIPKYAIKPPSQKYSNCNHSF